MILQGFVMIDKILSNANFHELMKKGIFQSIAILMNEEIEFSVVANTALVDFDPPLPDELKALCSGPFIIFAIGGYTFSSLELDENSISFHAGFGSSDYESKVSVNLAGITQIKVEDAIIYVNFSKPFREERLEEKSKNIFLKNNKNLFK